MSLKFSIIFLILFVSCGAQVSRLNDFLKNESKLFVLSNVSENERRFVFGRVNPDTKLTVPQLIAKHGYPVEVYTVQTEDNYVLTVHRIPYGIHNTTRTNRTPVLIMHGILASSADWVLLGPERSLPFLLADLGYDVWLGNARGNRHSRRHATLDPKLDADIFWNFSWHEIGMYDLPAMIDFILQKTNQKRLYYIGHSQGGTTFFVMTSMRPEYNDKIIAMFGLAPAVFMGHARSPILRQSAERVDKLEVMLKMSGTNEFLPKKSFMSGLAALLCDKESIIQGLCKNTLFMLAGFDEAQLDLERLPVFLAQTPAGCSTKQILHFLQNTRDPNNFFSQYDYGANRNQAIYKSITPKQYPLEKVTAPVALFSGYNDLFVDVQDVDKLMTKLPNVFLNYRVPFNAFTHLDFLWAKDVVPLLYNKVIEFLPYNV